MSKFEDSAREYILQLDTPTQQKAAIAIQDAFKNGRDWQWVATALRKKGIEEWQRWGFGLFFNDKFHASVCQQIERDERCKCIDVSGWLAGGGFSTINNTQEQLQELPENSPFYKLHAEGLESKRDERKCEDFRF